MCQVEWRLSGDYGRMSENVANSKLCQRVLHTGKVKHFQGTGLSILLVVILAQGSLLTLCDSKLVTRPWLAVCISDC
jgi:hypothetical protein